MTDEERLHMITEQLLIVRDNLFRGMSKSIQKLQAKSINEVLELPNFIESPQRQWIGLTWEEIDECFKITPDQYLPAHIYKRIETKLKQKNGYAKENT